MREVVMLNRGLPNLCLLVLLIFFSNSAWAEEVEVDGINLPFVISVDRRPNKDVSYSKCIGLFWNEKLKFTFLTGTTPTGDRECPGHEGLKFDYSENDRTIKVVGENGKIEGNSLDKSRHVQTSHKMAPYKGKIWAYSMLPFRVKVQVPSMTNPAKEEEDSFCVAFIRNKDQEGKTLDKTLIACDDCSTLQKCVDTELPLKKPLSVGGNKVGSLPHGRLKSEGLANIDRARPGIESGRRSLEPHI